MQVSYFYDASLGDFYYGPTHPMKPHRVRMAHDLIVRYDLYKHLQVRLQDHPTTLDAGDPQHKYGY
jgi:acetoin utilization deacetylase AcuC-like enzyme